jgi:hypothetical protein
LWLKKQLQNFHVVSSLVKNNMALLQGEHFTAGHVGGARSAQSSK